MSNRDLDGDAVIIVWLIALAILLAIMFSGTAHAQTTLQIVNARAGELYDVAPGARPDVFAQNKISFGNNTVDGWQQKIAAIRIDRIYPWMTPPTRQGWFKQETVKVCPLESDGSVKCTFDCGIDYQLFGVDSAGGIVATDGSLHHSFCGEVVSCHGCHDGHSVERAATLPPAAEAFTQTVAGKK